MSANLNKHLSTLSKRGPHRVLVGDLNYAGLPGKIYVPAEGNGVPGIAFGHDWTKSVKKYHATLRHLASWGIAVAAPDTETGAFPDHQGLASDLETCLQILGGVKLGTGKVTVSPKRLGLAGHGMGAGAAVLAAGRNPKVSALAAVYPAETKPSSYEAATCPSMIVTSFQEQLFTTGNPARLATQIKGDLVYRELNKGTQAGFAEDGLLNFALGLGFPQHAAQENIRALLTGYFLHQLGDENKYSAFSEPMASAKGIGALTMTEIREKAGFSDPSASEGLTALGGARAELKK